MTTLASFRLTVTGKLELGARVRADGVIRLRLVEVTLPHPEELLLDLANHLRRAVRASFKRNPDRSAKA